MSKITKEQFMSYERVRRGGRFNMLAPNARALSGLSKEVYSEIMLSLSAASLL